LWLGTSFCFFAHVGEVVRAALCEVLTQAHAFFACRDVVVRKFDVWVERIVFWIDQANGVAVVEWQRYAGLFAEELTKLHGGTDVGAHALVTLAVLNTAVYSAPVDA